MAFSVLAAAQARAVPTGQCKLVYTSATQLTLKPFQGAALKINGAAYTLPSGGISVTNAGLGPNVLAYVYAYINAGAVTLGFWTTGHTTDTAAGNVGVEIMNGDPTKSLVGMVQTNASGQFVDSNTNRQVRSWFNDSGVQFFNATSTTVSTSNTFWTELDAGVRIFVLGWAGEQFAATFAVSVSNNTLGATTYIVPWVDGGLFGLYTFMHAPAAGYYETVTPNAGSVFGSDSVRTLALAGQVGAGTLTTTNKHISGFTLRR
ncbi:hypothetical protein [Bradyrhizobium elkanii]|uniref:Porin n=1 Tax=Bradyrhizobium elkanii TaxID=29448 RepID=A0ABV4F054_BRAEL|nr:hypothetical protein [Bradyrhizobium elkanii]MCP1757831.1 hypothetical protein [Bradyrhizobium elkanii]MCS3881872.1 hypothetical protein [Bradyrhizobium elkanii]MCS4218631.1 hypothetical protein [Bradyrhizobium elkanii]MCW2110069.1 hypothetical protein [Bradyrhizobium elkanii]MCW2201559.1 hypothetical protein [Bradyrhizobium elkanii]